MPPATRREFLRQSVAASAVTTLSPLLARAASDPTPRDLHVATFRFDVSPPIGHSLCGGWIKPVVDYDDRLEAIGFVLLGAGKPIVICAVDWTGILNEAHLAWRTALAAAAGTTPDRVSVHCVHQHNAPLVCFDAERFVSGQPDLPHVFDRDFHRRCLDAARDAVTTALPSARRITHVAQGTARIEEVASNRRVERDVGGHVTRMRGSSCKDPALAALPEGTIDPVLRTVAFFDRATKIVACHYYATHPMSYYGDGRVSSDFCGLARKRRQQDEPGCAHLYFTGCAGNIAAGKYNDGSAASRVRLTERIYRGMVASESALRPEPLGSLEWRTELIQPVPNPEIVKAALQELMTKRTDGLVFRMRPAFKLASIQRYERKVPFVLNALHLNDVALLHLPAEPFVEYQLRAQALRPGKTVAIAAYGDLGPWYIPTAVEFPAGGYEVEYAFCEPATDEILFGAIRRLLG